jgi:hypothetical protein
VFSWLFFWRKRSSGDEKGHVSGAFQEWIADKEEMQCAAQEGRGGNKVLLVTDRRLVMLMQQGKEVTDSAEVLLKNFVGVRLHQSTWTSRLDVSIKDDNGDISIWRYESVKKHDATLAYQHLKHRELAEKEKPPKKKEEKKPPAAPHIVLRLDTANVDVDDDAKKEGENKGTKPSG